MTGTLLTVGETMALLTTPRIGRLRNAHALNVGIAGAESNVAIGFQRLGGTATWVGRTGDDELGAKVEATIRGTGVQTIALVDARHPTGLMLKERRSANVSHVLYYRRGSAGSRLQPEDVDEALVARAAVVHLTGITAALSESARDTVHATIAAARRHGAVVSFDFNYRSAQWSAADAAPVLRDLASKADVLFCTVEEAQLVVDGSNPTELAARLGALGPREVIVKLGEHGSVLWAERQLTTPAIPAPVVDTVGAGDAFAAGYLFELTRGAPIEERLRTATRTGAYAVTVDGDWEGAPTYEELGDLDRVGDPVRR